MATWSEQDTDIYQSLAQVVVPERETQVATLLTLFPFQPTDRFHVVELGCGEGRLAQAILTCFPGATYLGFDGSEAMRQTTQQRLAAHAERVEIAHFDLLAQDWQTRTAGVDVITSSLCLHHLPDAGKQQLYGQLVPQMTERGALLIADLVRPARPEAGEIFAAQWDRATAERSLNQMGSLTAYQRYLDEKWNYYRFPDPVDQPSTLFDQLRWLADAGLVDVDCFWLQAGHAIYGGYQAGGSGAPGVSFDAAYRHAWAAMNSRT